MDYATPTRERVTAGLRFVVEDPVVERTVRFDVADLGAGGSAERGQGADLVQDISGELLRGDVHGPPTKTGQVGIGNLRTDADVAFGGGVDCPVDGQRVAGVEGGIVERNAGIHDVAPWHSSRQVAMADGSDAPCRLHRRSHRSLHEPFSG